MDYSYIFRRQHPFYRRHRENWERSRSAYAGGSEYIKRALVQHVSEVDLEFLERRDRAYYFNYPRKIARIITQYILSGDPMRMGAEPLLVEDFSHSNLHVNEVMRQFSTLLNVYGKAWMLVEMPAFSGQVTPARRRQERIYPYAVPLSPLDVVDWSTADDGSLNWVLIEENSMDNSNVFAEPQLHRRRRLWTKNDWQLFENIDSEVKLVAQGEHALGVVPVVTVEEIDGYGMDAGHWFEDVVRISDAILNNESEAQMNVIKQMFGLLVISENFARGSRPQQQNRSDSSAKFSHVLARSAAIWESSEESGISRYISPHGAETAAIRSENASLKAELFDVVGLTIVRETREMQSAESKAWDHQQICQFLLNRVDLLEQAESSVWQLMQRYDGSLPLPSIAYNRDFSIIDLQKSVASLLELKSINSGKEFQKEVAKAAVTLLGRYQKIAPERQQLIFDEIEENISSGE